MYVDNGRVHEHLENPIWLWRQLSWQRNSKKTKGKGKDLALLYSHQKVETLNT
jgi:hypothetical protein